MEQAENSVLERQQPVDQSRWLELLEIGGWTWLVKSHSLLVTSPTIRPGESHSQMFGGNFATFKNGVRKNDWTLRQYVNIM